MAKMSELAGLSNQNTNHSLRVTAYTKKYNAGIPEKIIAHFSGHKEFKDYRNITLPPNLQRRLGWQ